MIRTEQLYYLVQVAKYNSITLAAKEMYLTKSAVSTAMKQLEKECGFDILERTYRGVKFTAKGDCVLEYAKQVLQILDEMANLKQNSDETEVANRRDLYVENPLMPLLQAKLIMPASGVLEQYNLQEIADVETIKEKLDDDNLSIVAMDENELRQQEEENIIIKELFSSRYYPVSSKRTRWIAHQVNVISKEEYDRLPKVLLGSMDSKAGYQYENVVLQTENSNVYVNAILNDVGIGMVTDFAEGIFIEKRKLLKVYEPIDDNTIYIVIMMKNAGDLSRAQLIEHVLKE